MNKKKPFGKILLSRLERDQHFPFLYTVGNIMSNIVSNIVVAVDGYGCDVACYTYNTLHNT